MDLLRNLQKELRRTADEGLAKMDAVEELFKAEVLYKYVHIRPVSFHAHHVVSNSA